MKIDSLRLSHSSRKMGQSCWRKLEFRKFHMNSNRQESLAGNVGNALHEGYQTWLLTKDKEQAAFDFMLKYPYKYEKSINDYRSLEACYSTLLALMESQVLAQYELAYIEIDGKPQPCIEVPFQINIADFSLSDDEDVPVTYIGFMDLILYDNFNDVYIVVDIKTTRLTTDDMTPIYRFDEQCIPYAIVLERLLGRELNGLTVKYLSAYIDILEPKIRPYEFQKSQEDIHDWMRGFVIDLQMIKTFYQLGWFPRNSGACWAWNKCCQFYNECQSRDEPVVDAMLEFSKKPESTGRDEEFKPWVTLDLAFQL